MQKEFNITGVCVPEENYMVDISQKITSIMKMVEKGHYFVIHRPRQYGKTTTLYMLAQKLRTNENYYPISISFEDIGEDDFKNAKTFIEAFLDSLKEAFIAYGDEDLAAFLKSGDKLKSMKKLSLWITDLVQTIGKKTVLMIDEVDKSSNNELFLEFLGILRKKYLERKSKKIPAFHSVILAGVHDIKTLKQKIRPDSETKYNSPWNIAAHFRVDLNFSSQEIIPMLEEYAAANEVKIDFPAIAEKIVYYTSGYPFLVSLICKTIAEEIMPQRSAREWFVEDVEQAIQLSLKESNTNFESLIKNLENHKELYNYVFDIVINGANLVYNKHDSIIQMGELFGILKDQQNQVRIHNRIYEQIIYDYMTSCLVSAGAVKGARLTVNFLDETGNLDIQKVFSKFQEFIKENYSSKDHDFLERNGRLIFLAYLRPILNGRGFDFKEVQISDEMRLDVVVTFDTRKYIIELKIWRGESYHQEGIRQLCKYLEAQHLNTGYLLIFDLRKESSNQNKTETITINGKTIIAAWV